MCALCQITVCPRHTSMHVDTRWYWLCWLDQSAPSWRASKDEIEQAWEKNSASKDRLAPLRSNGNSTSSINRIITEYDRSDSGDHYRPLLVIQRLETHLNSENRYLIDLKYFLHFLLSLILLLSEHTSMLRMVNVYSDSDSRKWDISFRFLLGLSHWLSAIIDFGSLGFH